MCLHRHVSLVRPLASLPVKLALYPRTNNMPHVFHTLRLKSSYSPHPSTRNILLVSLILLISASKQNINVPPSHHHILRSERQNSGHYAPHSGAGGERPR